MTKTDIIKKVYFDPSGYGSIQKALSDATQIDATIKLDNVKHCLCPICRTQETTAQGK